MRENRLSGSEGGGAELNRLSLPLSKSNIKCRTAEVRPDFGIHHSLFDILIRSL
jgi:hypothetical protein